MWAVLKIKVTNRVWGAKQNGRRMSMNLALCLRRDERFEGPPDPVHHASTVHQKHRTRTARVVLPYHLPEEGEQKEHNRSPRSTRNART